MILFNGVYLTYYRVICKKSISYVYINKITISDIIVTRTFKKQYKLSETKIVKIVKPNNLIKCKF